MFLQTALFGKLLKLSFPYIYSMSNVESPELSEELKKHEDEGHEPESGAEEYPARHLGSMRLKSSIKRIFVSSDSLDSERMKKTAERYNMQREYDPRSDPLVLEIWTTPEIGRL